MNKPVRICLNMIVRDEEANIPDCLEGLAHILDAFAIVDTGSSDHTVAAIHSFASAAKIPGEVITRPWVDFGHNRTEALQHAGEVIGRMDPQQCHAWYVLFMDADDRVSGLDGNSRFSLQKQSLTADRYDVEMRHGSVFYHHPWLIRESPAKKWKWLFPVHEYLAPDGDWTPSLGLLQGGFVQRNTAGIRARNNMTFLEDAFILLKWLKNHPQDPRAVFYLAQSFRDSGFPDLAQVCYRERVSLGGWSQEVYESYLQLGVFRFAQNDFGAETVDFFLRAFETCPNRLDAPYYLMRIWRSQESFRVAWAFAKALIDIPPPTDGLFMNRAIHEWAFLEEAGLSAYYAGDRNSFQSIMKRVLQVPGLPEEARSRTTFNLSTYGVSGE